MDDDGNAASELPLAPHVLEILVAISQRPLHGYAIIRAIEAQSDGAVTLSTSSLYAALNRMARKGWVEDAGRMAGEDSGGPPRKYFRISDLGTRVAKLETLRVRRLSALAEQRFLGAAGHSARATEPPESS